MKGVPVTFVAPVSVVVADEIPCAAPLPRGEPQQRAIIFAPCPFPGFLWGSPALRGMQLSRPTTMCMWLASPRHVGRPVGVGLAAPSLFTFQGAADPARVPLVWGESVGAKCVAGFLVPLAGLVR